ncbi:unnamed protein product [Rhizoctonia solani]|uniref:WD40 repeat-like protein n=1 Tax=Rhizoctonia solani TaxID=456999 RepID=A0A8H3DT82_9AGAM|nr:unnamed protein product [Rhizoctonia solani]
MEQDIHHEQVRLGGDTLSMDPRLYVEGSAGNHTFNSARRKQNLLALLSELSDLRDAMAFEDSNPSNPVALGSPGVEAQGIQAREGLAAFRALDNQVFELTRQLQGFAGAIHPLGSSAGLINTTYHLRCSLIRVRDHFWENATHLFGEIQRTPRQGRGGTKIEGNRAFVGMRTKPQSLRDIEQLPEEMDKLAQQLHVFTHYLSDIPGFSDDLVKTSFLSFSGQLNYRASCLKEFKGQLQTVAVRRYVNDLLSEIGAYIEPMTGSLNDFIEFGVPIIQHAQKHTARNLQYLSVVATIFSVITATMIQYSYERTGNPLADLVNALWIISLVFSIASVVGSQLAYYWWTSIYRLRRNYVPWWVPTWIKWSPLLFFAGSIVAFLIGLCAFTYSSRQNLVVSGLVTGFSGAILLGLATVGLWFVPEQWFLRTPGEHQHSSALGEPPAKTEGELDMARVVNHTSKVKQPDRLRWIRHLAYNTKTALRKVYNYCMRRGPVERDEESQTHSRRAAASRSNNPPSDPSAPRLDDGLPPLAATLPPALSPVVNPPSSYNVNEPESPNEQEEPANMRFRRMVERIIIASRPREGVIPRRIGSRPPTRPRRPMEACVPTPGALRVRIQIFRSGLESLSITQLTTEHTALVKHAQFSPSGDFLATCSWDRTAIIWRVEGTVEMHARLIPSNSSSGGFMNQVAWSPNGDRLLTRASKDIKIWNLWGVCQSTIPREKAIQAVYWMPNGNGFLSVEHELQLYDGPVAATNLIQLDLDGRVLCVHNLDGIQIWDIAIMADKERILAVGTLVNARDNPQSIQSRTEKRLLVYNLKTKEVEHRVPLLQDVCNITLSAQVNGASHALLSYKDKTPPQMWRVALKAASNPDQHVARLALDRFEFTGQSFFGGPSEMFVCCASKSGELYIWDRNSTTLLHTLRADSSEGMKVFTGNQRAIPGFTLVSGEIDGTLRIWSSEIASPIQPTSSPGPHTPQD